MQKRKQACLDAGADESDNLEKVNTIGYLDLTDGEGADVAIDYVSATATLEAAAGALRRHGRMITLGGAGANFK